MLRNQAHWQVAKIHLSTKTYQRACLPSRVAKGTTVIKLKDTQLPTIYKRNAQ